MGLHGCSVTGQLEDSKFSEPLPWIGLYIAGASLLCSLAMAIDTFYGFRQRKLWFPCKFFSLNATSLTLLSIATKLPVDLNTSMPSRQDQLTKLSGTVLICIAMGNFMTSLGTMDDSEMLSNVIALGILVITVVVNIGIQMGTGVIYVFLPEHALIMFFMIILLVIMVSSAFTIPTAKELLEEHYNKKYEFASNERGDSAEMFKVDKLKEMVKKYWLMAHTCSPQYVLGRSATCTASGAFCLLSTLILLEASVRSLISLHFCNGESDYKWSTAVALFSQAIAVAVGTIAPAIRWFNAISFRSPESRNMNCKDEFKVEEYWVHRLLDWKHSPLPFRISNRQCRKIVHVSKDQILDVFIRVQTVVVVVCKFTRLVSMVPASWLSRLFCCYRQCWRKLDSNRLASESLQDFVLHLEGEEDLVHLIMKSSRKDIEQWIDKGKKNPPTYLRNLLEKSTSSEGFKGVAEFDSDQVPSAGEKPRNCWALPVATLTSIAIALPSVDQNMIRSLRLAVDEGLRYVRLIEKNLDANGLRNMRDAADRVWVGVDIYDRWLDKDLHKLVAKEKHAEKIIGQLAEIGLQRASEFTTGIGSNTQPREWPVTILAATSMYRISRTILQDHQDKIGNVDILFEWLQTTIADILGACLTNLPRAISMECYCSSIEVREEKVREATYFLGQAESILATFGKHQFRNLGLNQLPDIDEWRSSTRTEPPHLPSDDV